MRLKDLEAAIDLRGRLAEAEKLRADVSGYTERMTIEPFGIDLPGDFDPPSADRRLLPCGARCAGHAGR